MKKVLIIEDEPLARERLRKMILHIESNIEILAELDTVASSVEWLKQHPAPDLAFFDIQLADGISFEIFNQIEIDFPIIFTTAFDEYSIKAFKVNSIDYLLKPFTKDELQAAIEKYNKYHSKEKAIADASIIHELLALSKAKKEYRKRIMLRIGDKLISIETDQILYIYSLQKATYARMLDGKEYLLDESLDTLEPQLNPEFFFRINRQYIAHMDSVKDIIAWTNSRLKLNLKDCKDDDIFVSRNKASEFKAWLDK